jgi:hypothetical protein
MPQVPNTEKLDEHLLEIVRALHAPLNRAYLTPMIQQSWRTR